MVGCAWFLVRCQHGSMVREPGLIPLAIHSAVNVLFLLHKFKDIETKDNGEKLCTKVECDLMFDSYLLFV